MHFMNVENVTVKQQLSSNLNFRSFILESRLAIAIHTKR